MTIDRRAPLHLTTPLIGSATLDDRLGSRLLVKMEAHQPPGSFKIRGIGHMMQTLAAEGQDRFVCSSGGNAGLAVAYAAARLDAQATVVVPATTTAEVVKALTLMGCEVLVRGDVWDHADEAARELCASRDAAYIHPFDHPLLWEGHATLIDEAARQGPRPAAVLVSVGGGGLLCGVLEGMHRNGWRDVPVLAIETEGAASYAAALAAGRPVRLPAIASVAKSLGALQVCERAVEWAGRHDIRPVVIPDAAAVIGCLLFADILRTLVEPACGAVLGAIERRAVPRVGDGPLLAIACGGAGVTRAALDRWRQETADEFDAASSVD